MKTIFTLILLALAVLYFSPAANARTVHIAAKHKHYNRHHGAHKNAHQHPHGHRHSKAQV